MLAYWDLLSLSSLRYLFSVLGRAGHGKRRVAHFAARALAICRIGPYSMPFEVCEERFYTPGLLPKILTGDTSYLEPEAESPPLDCPAASP